MTCGHEAEGVQVTDGKVPPGTEEAIAEGKYDGIVSDYEWWPTNGVEFAKALRGKNIQVPIMLRSAHDEADIRKQHPEYEELNLRYCSKEDNELLESWAASLPTSQLAPPVQNREEGRAR